MKSIIWWPRRKWRLRMVIKRGVHVGYQVFSPAERPGTATHFNGNFHFHSYQWFPGAEPPEFCAADRDGDCNHPGCPQLTNWQSRCPIPDYPEEA